MLADRQKEKARQTDTEIYSSRAWFHVCRGGGKVVGCWGSVGFVMGSVRLVIQLFNVEY